MATGRVPTTANSPLTAKGDLFGYSTTQARVPVGSDGETLVADSSASTGLRWSSQFLAGKNKIINGDFFINQRGFSSTTTSGYHFDRWQGAHGSSGVTYSSQTFTLGTAPVAGYEGKTFYRTVTTGQVNAGDYAINRQFIEGVRTFANQTVTVSFWAKAASGTPSVAVDMYQIFGTGGSPSSSVDFGGSKQTLSTSWARYSFTINVPSISGKTIGTNNDDYLALRIWWSAGSTYNTQTNSLGNQNNTFDIWGVQVEAGSVATPFSTATGTLAGELAACQRYYERSNPNGEAGLLWSGNVTNATTYYYAVNMKVQKRTAPTITLTTVNTSGNFGTITTSAIGEYSFRIQGTANSTTSGSYIALDNWNASAEL